MLQIKETRYNTTKYNKSVVLDWRRKNTINDRFGIIDTIGIRVEK